MQSPIPINHRPCLEQLVKLLALRSWLRAWKWDERHCIIYEAQVGKVPQTLARSLLSALSAVQLFHPIASVGIWTSLAIPLYGRRLQSFQTPLMYIVSLHTACAR